MHDDDDSFSEMVNGDFDSKEQAFRVGLLGSIWYLIMIQRS
jgi:hypothetical protein